MSLAAACGWSLARGLVLRAELRDKLALLLETLPALDDPSFSVLEMLVAKTHAGLLLAKEPEHYATVTGIPGRMQPRQIELDIALGHKHFHGRHSNLPSG